MIAEWAILIIGIIITGFFGFGVLLFALIERRLDGLMMLGTVVGVVLLIIWWWGLTK